MHATTLLHARLLAPLCALAALAFDARATDTLTFADGTFGASWISAKVLDTSPGSLATFTSTTLPGGPSGAYRETSHTYANGAIGVAHWDPANTHQPAVDPICKLDFSASLVHLTGVTIGGAVAYRLAILQSGAWYGGPSIDVFPNLWASYAQSDLHAEDFTLLSGSGPAKPDFTCSGGTMQFGFLSLNSASGGPVTKVSGIDDWTVTLHLAKATYYEPWPNPNWSWTKVVDTTPGSSGNLAHATIFPGGNPGWYYLTDYSWINGTVVFANVNLLASHDPSIEPVYTIDFACDLQYQYAATVGGSVGLAALVRQGGSFYASQTLQAFSQAWVTYVQTGLSANDFVKLSGPGPNHPDFTNSGSLLQFGYAISDAGAGGQTKRIGVDNWTVCANLNPPCPGTLGIGVCGGDDITNPCPCFPSVGPSAPGHGCQNSIDPYGGLVVATGAASIGNDTAILHGSHMPSSFCLYFQGTLVTGVPFGDGRLCASGTILRLAVKLNICNASQYPSSSEPSLSVQGQVTTPGQRVYQIWYRDSAAFCTGATYNLTNALVLNWTL